MNEFDGAFKELADSYRLTEDQLLNRFNVKLETGLNDGQVEANRKKYGRNEFPEEEGTSIWMMILKQFEDTLVIILIVAALISFVLAFFEDDPDERFTAFVEPLVIVVILIANATVGVLQESSAEKAVEALKQYEVASANVRRNGHLDTMNAQELVVGDIVELEAGQQVPADIRLLEMRSSALDVDQALLTGESENVGKSPAPVDIVGAVAQDKKNILFSGSMVVRGKGIGIVIGTGLATEKGKIRKALGEDDEEPFPLKKRLDEFGNQLSVTIGILCLIVWIINIGNFSNPIFDGWIRGAIYYFKIAISLAVAAIPEGLPAVVTTCLALGTQRMAKKNAIVRALPAVETLGCTSVICSDKTGTLTTNQMSVERFFTVGPNSTIVEFEVEGNSYAPQAEGRPFRVTPSDNFSGKSPIKDDSVIQAMAICSLCNESSISYKESESRYVAIGQSTEAAMKVLVEKVGFPSDENVSKLPHQARALAYNNMYAGCFEKVYTLEFDRARKSMSVLANAPKFPAFKGKGRYLLVKGAWDNVLQRCEYVSLSGEKTPMKADLRKQLADKIHGYCTGAHSYRCLVLAYQDDVPFSDDEIKSADSVRFSEFESKLTFVGVVGILDPPRAEVPAAIEKCYRAGIDVIVITGDNMDTAAAICRKIGIFDPNESIVGKAFTGKEFKAMSDEQKVEAVKNARLFSRVEPLDKQELVRCLHKLNKICAMTGDGVNDAPALKSADIGLAMGSGTSVAKGASAMILADDNFATIVAAIEEGRSIYNNTKQFIRYLICSNIGEVVAIFITAVFGLPEVLLPVQLLWVNLVTDGFPAIALGFNPAEDGIMEEYPRPKDEPIVSGYTLLRYLITGTYIGVATVWGMVWHFVYSDHGPKLQFEQLFLWTHCEEHNLCHIFEDNTPNTISLSILVTIEMFAALNSLSSRQSILSRHGNPLNNVYLIGAISLSFFLHFVILYVPLLAKVFQIEPLTLHEWQAVIAFSAPVILLEEIIKFIDRNFGTQRVKVTRGGKVKSD
jgi:P-type Ca2+ transporter type 2A